jgi:type I restriction-modification system DNA methylase subunit
MVFRMPKTKLAKNNETGVQRFTADITNCIRDLAPILTDSFESIRKGEVGVEPRDLVLKLFDEWLHRSNLPKVEDACKYLQKVLPKWGNRVERIRLDIKKNLVGLGNLDSLSVELTSKIAKGTKITDAVSNDVWIAYVAQIRSFTLQTAHFIVSRLLMYLVGVDKKAWEALVVQNVDKPYLQFYWNLRASMSDFLPGLYFLNEFDWLYMPDAMKQGLSADNKRVLGAIEDKLDVAVGRFFREICGQYDYTEMDMDVWKTVYQKFLSPEDVNKLGFVTTPDEIVDLVLDLVGYIKSEEGLCKKTILDPACGSGTFLVEALVRLKEHLYLQMKCHHFDEREPMWERDKKIIENVTSNIHGIDINPFATFLTTTNLTFQLIENYSNVRHKHPEFSLEFDVVTHDALARSPPASKTLATENGRLKEAVKRSEKYAKLCNKKYDYVVGNPPWGSILKGGIGPLGDKKTKLDYKARFESAYDKYDIFVLFMERGIKWTNKNGLVGMITQNTWPSTQFGEGIKKVIRQRTSVEYFIDMGTLGRILFPQKTNYPAITVLRAATSEEEPIVVEVTEK